MADLPLDGLTEIKARAVPGTCPFCDGRASIRRRALTCGKWECLVAYRKAYNADLRAKRRAR